MTYEAVLADALARTSGEIVFLPEAVAIGSGTLSILGMMFFIGFVFFFAPRIERFIENLSTLVNKIVDTIRGL